MNSRQRRTAARSHPLYHEVKEALGRRPVPEDFKLIETVKRKLAGLDNPYEDRQQRNREPELALYGEYRPFPKRAYGLLDLKSLEHNQSTSL